MKINENMFLYEILDMDEDIEQVFLRHGLNCVGCPGAQSENLKEAAEGHCINLSALLNDLNKFLEDK